LYTTKPLAPDLNKINPIQGMGRLFSKRSLVEMVKSLVKVLVVGWVAYHTLEGYFDEALHLNETDLSATVAFMGRVAAVILFKSSGILLLLGILDFLYVRWEMEEKMKMTKQEQKEEHKETEGDPQVKAKVRAIQQSMARKRMMAEVPEADVVVTNPTHLSVALAYRQGEMAAPKVVAKGADALALRIREIAREHGVPIVENQPVARALYKIELEHFVPEELYKAVAEILAYVYGLKK
jgi:flagellar biosynthetic protein FlhB